MRLDNTHQINKKTPKKALKKQDGFTLIEVLVALTIFAVGLLAIAVMQTSAIRMNFTGNRLTELSTLGIDKYEELMSLPYTDPQLAVGGPYTDPNPPAGYTVRWTVVQDILVANTKCIELKVTGKGKILRRMSIRGQSL
ncbi:MAG: prepilin-type N-terminal cleavage/methylation domain-containing protein [Desulfobacterales bacterium]